MRHGSKREGSETFPIREYKCNHNEIKNSEIFNGTRDECYPLVSKDRNEAIIYFQKLKFRALQLYENNFRWPYKSKTPSFKHDLSKLSMYFVRANHYIESLDLRDVRHNIDVLNKAKQTNSELWKEWLYATHAGNSNKRELYQIQGVFDDAFKVKKTQVRRRSGYGKTYIEPEFYVKVTQLIQTFMVPFNISKESPRPDLEKINEAKIDSTIIKLEKQEWETRERLKLFDINKKIEINSDPTKLELHFEQAQLAQRDINKGIHEKNLLSDGTIYPVAIGRLRGR